MNSIMIYLMGFGIGGMLVWVAWEYAYDAWAQHKQSKEANEVETEESGDTEQSQEDDNSEPPLAAA